MAHFVELNRSYYPAKFHWHRLSGSNFTGGGGGGGQHLPSDLHPLKKPSPYRVKWMGCCNFNPIHQAGVFWYHIIPSLLLCYPFICGSINTKLGTMILWDKFSQKP